MWEQDPDLVESGILANFWLALLAVAAAVCYPTSLLLTRLGLRHPPDPWRRSLGLGLRGEGTKFVLSAFGLRLPQGGGLDLSRADFTAVELQLLDSFGAFLAVEPDVRFALRFSTSCDSREPIPRAEVTLARFSPDGELLAFAFREDESSPARLHPAQRQRVEQTVLEHYNRTRSMPEQDRVREATHLLCDMTEAGTAGSHAAEYARRILESTLVSVDAASGPDRFGPPDFRRSRSLGLGVMNAVFRPSPAGDIDVWLQIHHVGADGAPSQELLGRLERAWGLPAPVEFPSPGGVPRWQDCSMPDEAALTVGVGFLDFSGLIRRREELSGELQGLEEIPMVAMFLWELAAHPRFNGVRFAVAVDVPAWDGADRAVDLISVRPADFFEAERDRVSFVKYIRHFRQQIEDARDRASRTWCTMERAAVLPASLAASILAANPAGAAETFGSVGLSMLRDARIFLAPMSDPGFDGGFLAIGNLCLPAAGTATVGAVSFKGRPDRVAGVFDALRSVLDSALVPWRPSTGDQRGDETLIPRSPAASIIRSS